MEGGEKRKMANPDSDTSLLPLSSPFLSTISSLLFHNTSLLPLFSLFLKGKFYYYSGMVRPTDQEMITIEKIVWGLPR